MISASLNNNNSSPPVIAAPSESMNFSKAGSTFSNLAIPVYGGEPVTTIVPSSTPIVPPLIMPITTLDPLGLPTHSPPAALSSPPLLLSSASSSSTTTTTTTNSSPPPPPQPFMKRRRRSSSAAWPEPLVPTMMPAPSFPDTRLSMLRFHVVLQASTAATQISEGSPTTYLNRGQAYAIDLKDTYQQDTLLTSTFMIMFHEPAHRKVALNYWKFWLGQQNSPADARAVALDERQSAGVYNVRFPSFDRITFDWNGRAGAKITVRFNCLSTDFSRIKGVKGIPLRAHMETQVLGLGLEKSLEQCYCKIKLFRDKGAERKNKDDARQIGRHLERVYAEGNPHQHPFWLMYNQPRPYSVFSEIPTSPPLETLESIRSTLFPSIDQQPQPPAPTARPTKRSFSEIDQRLELYVQIKTTQHQRFQSASPALPPQQQQQRVLSLDRRDVRQLITKLCPVLSLHPSQVSEVLWRQPKDTVRSATPVVRTVSCQHQQAADHVYVLVNDTVLQEQFTDHMAVSVEWEIKSDGTVRILLH